MKLSYYCSSCKKENYLKTKKQDRYGFLDEYGNNEINERCKHCGNFTKRHINRLHAEQNYYIIVGGLVFAVLFSILFWDLGFVTTLTGTVPIGIWMNENKKNIIF
jgi:uncharacterized membrane protein